MPSIEIRERRVSWRRLLAGGIVLAALCGIAGGGLELWWFGRTGQAAARRSDTYLRARFDRMAGALALVSGRIAADPAAAAGLTPAADGARRLFDLVASARRASPEPDRIAVTIYDSGAVARAWAGEPSDNIPNDRLSGAATLFVTRSPLGLRLVHLQPIVTGDGRRVGSVASEYGLSPAPAVTAVEPAEFTLDTPLAPAILRPRFEGAGEIGRPDAVVLRGPSGEPLAEAWVAPASLQDSRARWRRHVGAAMLAVFGTTLLLLVGPLLDRRVTSRSAPDTVPDGAYVRATVGALGLVAGGGATLWLACAVDRGGLPSMPATMLLGGGTAAALVSLLAGPVARLRIATRRVRLAIADARVRFVASQLLAGTVMAGLFIAFNSIIEWVVDPASIDLRHFSLHPWTSARLFLLGGVAALHLAVLWGATLLLVVAFVRWRLPRRSISTATAILVLWGLPPLLAALAAVTGRWPVAAAGLLLSAAACSAGALAGPWLARWYRRTTVAARIFALFAAFLIPTLLLYPTMDYFAERATRRLIETQYAVQAQNHVRTLLKRMEDAQAEIDAIAVLPELLRGQPAEAPGAAPSEPAYWVWQQTALARERLTSAVELYDDEGGLVSRFALNVPEHVVATPQGAAGCRWDVFGEVAPFGAEERRMLHAERRLCVPGDGGASGSIILHVVLEYQTLPFITSQNPYFEIFRAAGPRPQEGTPGGSVEVALYGWGLQPLYTSNRTAWPITDELFAKLYASRQPFWADATAGGTAYRVYFSNDRDRIFAIGYPILTPFDHFVHLAELTTFSAAAFALVLFGTALFTRLARERPRVGRALLREIRASFYRKLFLAFVLAAIIPVLTLALVIRAYFANLLYADIEAEAARTASVAQRVIEEADAPLRRSAEALGTLRDDVMVSIEQVIEQDVNVFKGADLVATSERDLFASGVLPTRTPDDVYRAIVLQRLPSFVRQDAIGGFTYVLAATPVRTAGEDALLTVPLALRQREIEREIDELDEGVHLAALCFVLVGAALGLYMAERIADPVRRLTRATGRIARGDFDARIAVKSVDELRRLVDAFNSMAAELKAQRVQLERTHRLEAWAEMARQVAHEIKNPLTPIQLSAEHLQRVHADRGAPMGAVLDSCVTSILGQVRLLRQISSEFSSFASAPTARRAPLDLPALVAEVIDPYRTGLRDRIDIVNRVPAELPPVLVDRTLVSRALVNIVENALHAMPGEGLLTIDGVAEPDAVRLAVTDTGGGMDEEALGRVFEPYFSTKATGTGLGLPIARRNIEVNGGTITVASAKGAGTTVTVRLPLAGPGAAA